MEKTKIILEKYFNAESLLLGWERYISSTGFEYKDLAGVQRYQTDLNENLRNLSNYIIAGKYKPTRPFKYFEPKASGMQRTKSVLIIEDAIVYQAIVDTIAYSNYDELTSYCNEFVFGSVLHPNVKLGVKLLDEDVPKFYFFKYYFPLYQKFLEGVNLELDNEEVVYKFETDITGFFDCIPHSILSNYLSEFDVEDIIIDLLIDCLNVWSGTRYSMTPGVGIPQGPVPSFFIGNLLLHNMDKLLAEESFGYFRFMDDIRIFGPNDQQLRNVLIKIDTLLKGMGLSLNSKKTYIEKIKDREKEKVKLKKYISYDYEEEDDQRIEVKSPDNEKFSGQESQKDDFKLFFEVMSDDDLNDFCKNEIKEVTSFCLSNDSKIKRIITKEDEEDSELIDDFRDAAFRYRRAFRMLSKTNLVAKPSPKLLPFWFTGVEWLYYKANNFLWNIAQYINYDETGVEVKQKLFSWLDNGIAYEWVTYHIIITLICCDHITKSDKRKIYELLVSTESPLIRKACYKFLVTHLSTKDQLFAKVRKRLEKEDQFQVKTEIYNDILLRKDFKISLAEVLESFGQ